MAGRRRGRKEEKRIEGVDALDQGTRRRRRRGHKPGLGFVFVVKREGNE
jgi:hypothetical protein